MGEVDVVVRRDAATETVDAYRRVNNYFALIDLGMETA